MPVLVIQRGHCYRKTGATGTTGEQAYATAVANACVKLLHGRSGWTVRAILADDDLVDYRGDAFVAIHCDGSIHSTARGASIGYRNRSGQLFGQAWKRAYAARGWTGGFRPDNYTAALQGYYGTGNAVAQGNTRAFIAECGFRTNPEDRELLDEEGGPERVALAIGDALGITSTPAEDDMTPDQAATLDYVKRIAIENQRRIGLARGEIASLATLVAADKDIDPAELQAMVDGAVKAATPTAEQTAAALLPLVEDIAARVLGVDNKKQAAEILRQLREALPANEGN